MHRSDVAEDPRATLKELAADIEAHFGRRLLGLYLFGSLAAAGFYPGRSDLDLVAVLDTEVADGPDLDSLRTLHEAFEAARPEWRDRIEVLYISRAVLASFATTPTGMIARISPGEPMHLRDLDGIIGWILDWYGVLSVGERLSGPPPLELGPEVSRERFLEAVRSELVILRTEVRANTVAYVPAQQGYLTATICRALYSLAIGEQTSKERAVEWAAARHPESADFLRAMYAAYRADIRGPHERLIRFVDSATAEAGNEA